MNDLQVLVHWVRNLGLDEEIRDQIAQHEIPDDDAAVLRRVIWDPEPAPEHETNGERRLDISDKVTTLYGLIVVELAGARKLANKRINEHADVYALGRCGGYEFVLTAMEMRWPELEEFRKVYEVIEHEP